MVRYGLNCRTVVSRLADIYEIVNDPSSDLVISWGETGKSFIVWRPAEFARDYLPTLLHCRDFWAFTRMLQRFGFAKVSPQRWEFAGEDFVRGEPELIHNMFDRKRAEARTAVKIIRSQRKNLKATKAVVDQLQSLQI